MSPTLGRGGKKGGVIPQTKNFLYIYIYIPLLIPINMKYDAWQKEILNASGDIVVNTGRQVGKTMIFSHKIAKHMLNNPKNQIIVVSLTEDQAQLIIVMIQNYLQKNAPNSIDNTKKNKPTKSRVSVKNGSRVISRPVGNTGDAVRGFTGNVLYIDEAAGMPEMMWKAAMPTLATTGGQIWMSSTPRGKFQQGKGSEKNFFYKCWENKDKKWKVFNISTEEVYKTREIDDIDWNEEKKEKAIEFLINQKTILSDIEYKQEYLGIFLDDSRQWFDDKIIRKCMTAKRPEKIESDWLVGMGNDIARKGIDAGSYEIFRVERDRLIQIENQKSFDQPITTTCDQIIGLDEKFKCDKIFIDDEGSLGKGVFDILLKDERTREKIIGISNSKRIIDRWGKEKGIKKEELYVTLLSMMEKGNIELLDDEDLFQSFKSVQYAYTNDSLGKRHLKIFGHDTHIVEGVTRATEILKYKDLNPIVYTIKI